MSRLNFLRDSQSIPSWCRPFTAKSYSRVLTGESASVPLAVPDKSAFAIFVANDVFFVSDQDDITLPTDASWSQNNALMSPAGIIVFSPEFNINIDTLYFKAPHDTMVNISFYTP